jgi:AmmeMemoRadiSam system protein B
MDYPKLRPVEAIPAQDRMICLRDPEGFSDKILLLPLEAFFIISHFDGCHSIVDIQAAFTRQFGNLLFSDKISDLIGQLDNALFLESDHFQEVRDRAVQEFRSSPLRMASHAGLSYEADGKALRKQLDGLFTEPVEPDLPDTTSTGGRLCGLIAPHIDIRRGGACFASGYTELARECRARIFVILGISHVSTARRFVLTDKDFDTPLGVVSTDHTFIEKLSKRCSRDYFEDELVHRNEHSVEFQAVMLKYLYPDREDLRIVPILCSSKDEILTDSSPAEDPEFQEFTAAIRGMIDGYGDEVCLIAGVDLSHLGQRFGQVVTMTPAFLEQAEADDMEMIELIIDKDADGFFDHIREEQNHRNVCGVPAIHTLLTLVDTSSARLLRYGQSVDEQTQSVVTFMAAALYV